MEELWAKWCIRYALRSGERLEAVEKGSRPTGSQALSRTGERGRTGRRRYKARGVHMFGRCHAVIPAEAGIQGGGASPAAEMDWPWKVEFVEEKNPRPEDPCPLMG